MRKALKETTERVMVIISNQNNVGLIAYHFFSYKDLPVNFLPHQTCYFPVEYITVSVNTYTDVDQLTKQIPSLGGKCISVYHNACMRHFSA